MRHAMLRVVQFAVLIITVASQSAFAKGTLENPGNGSAQSGIAVISGWNCDATGVEIQIDGTITFDAAYGTARYDTNSVCGDDNNGFGMLFNMNRLGTGEHTIVAYADGVEFGRSTFTVTSIDDAEFLTGLSGETRIKGFPNVQSDLVLKWQEASQSFVVLRQEPSSDPFSASGVWEVPEAGLVGIHVGDSVNGVAEVVAIITSYEGEIDVLEGESSANTMRLITTVSNVDVTVEITLTVLSASTAQAKIDRCTPSSDCAFPTGTILPLNKLFP